MAFTTREPAPDDAVPLADLHVLAWRETYAHLLPRDFFNDEYVEARRQMWHAILSNPREDEAIRVAQSDHEIIGFAWAQPATRGAGDGPPRDRELNAIYLAQAHYGSGAAQVLLDETLGPGPATVWVAKGNPRAIAFYRRNGFDFDGQERTDPNAAMITAARMIRS